ncbi:MAG: F0F1 ATP synthase subunit B [Fimbriimonas ginsengisoli]|uniref:ATP synthase subunit b n=1 Tax=Fimbriimonas ginsengisoli TaxID=1005039 RepID=A0A931PWP2_FIMGI|nr:F0F1 ATP synthase subunit B [Fimbriimonas ginsengisoli]MBI3721196.1 F0F1 ATP synthase subunit B [Fimbriimonas ginsengisoli]
MSTERNSGGAAAVVVATVIGIGLMMGGMYVSLNVHLGFVEAMNKSGIPFDPGKTVSMMGVLLILFPVIRIFFIAPLAAAIGGRTSELERTFAEAEELRGEMTKMRSEYEHRLVQTEADARERIQAEIKKAQELGQALRAEAASHADELRRKAEREIEAEKNRVLTELRLHVVNLSLGATEKLLGENMDSATNRKLVQDFVDKAGAAR